MEQSCIIKASDCTKELTYRSEALERTSKAEKEEEEEEESKEKKEKKKVQTTKLVAEILKIVQCTLFPLLVKINYRKLYKFCIRSVKPRTLQNP